MENTISRSQIKNIGKRLRISNLGTPLDSKDLEILNKWRSYHESSLKYYAKKLKEEASNLNLNSNDYTVTQRIKRVHSIILKLKRFPLMQLSMMDDIAGARIVLPNNLQVSQLVETFKNKKNKHELIKLKNYISHPKEDGYRSIHAVYKINKQPTIHIEIQFRSLLQHCWATGVEVFGTLEKTSFKTGEGTEEWKHFFRLLSSRFAIKENTPLLAEHEIYSAKQIEQQLIATIRKLNIIEQLNTYTSLYSSDWRSMRAKGRSGKYALITLDTIRNNTDVKFFAESKFQEALNQYAAIEKVHHSSNDINVVLVNLDNINNLERAYPNYFMNTKLLVNLLSCIVLGEF